MYVFMYVYARVCVALKVLSKKERGNDGSLAVPESSKKVPKFVYGGW